MLYAILTQADPKQLGVKEYLETVDRGHVYLNEQVRRGRVRELFVRAGGAAGLWIVDCESREEVQELLDGNPTAPYAHYEVIPLNPAEKPAMANDSQPHETQHTTRFADTLVIRATPQQVYDILWNVEDWPRLLPHVRSVKVHEASAKHQDFEMETVGPAGAHKNRSTRHGHSPHSISYEQILPPALFRSHCGVWTIRSLGDQVEVESAHEIVIEPGQIEAVLGRQYTPQEAALLSRHFVGNHSVATLNIIKGLVEATAGSVEATL